MGARAKMSRPLALKIGTGLTTRADIDCIDLYNCVHTIIDL